MKVGVNSKVKLGHELLSVLLPPEATFLRHGSPYLTLMNCAPNILYIETVELHQVLFNFWLAQISRSPQTNPVLVAQVLNLFLLLLPRFCFLLFLIWIIFHELGRSLQKDLMVDEFLLRCRLSKIACDCLLVPLWIHILLKLQTLLVVLVKL